MTPAERKLAEATLRQKSGAPRWFTPADLGAVSKSGHSTLLNRMVARGEMERQIAAKERVSAKARTAYEYRLTPKGLQTLANSQATTKLRIAMDGPGGSL